MKRKKRVGIKDFEKKLQVCEEKLNEATKRWQRALADYQNLEKRTQREKEQFAAFAANQLIEKLLPMLDNLKRAGAHIQDRGLNIAIDLFEKVLQEEGLEQIMTEDKQFDPTEMECIELVSGKNENIVVEEVRTGYKIDDKVIRPAQVKVGK